MSFRKGYAAWCCARCAAPVRHWCAIGSSRLGIAHLTQPVTDNKVNLYFGNRLCLDAVKTFVHKPLNELSPEEDFMLGAMLGYDITGQCERYCKRKVRTA